MKTKALETLLALKKPSQLFSLALDDLEAVQRNLKYEINMSQWVYKNEDKDTCEVCLAGALMVNRLNVTPAQWNKHYDNQRNDDPLVTLARSLDDFRSGDIPSACNMFFKAGKKEERINRTQEKFLEDLDMPDYYLDHEAFIAAGRVLIEQIKDQEL